VTTGVCPGFICSTAFFTTVADHGHCVGTVLEHGKQGGGADERTIFTVVADHGHCVGTVLEHGKQGGGADGSNFWWLAAGTEICSRIPQHCRLGPALHCAARDILSQYAVSPPCQVTSP